MTDLINIRCIWSFLCYVKQKRKVKKKSLKLSVKSCLPLFDRSHHTSSLHLALSSPPCHLLSSSSRLTGCWGHSKRKEEQKKQKKQSRVTGLTGDDAPGEGGQEAHADQHQGDEAAPLVALQRDHHEQPHRSVDKERGEETPQEHPVPHLWQGDEGQGRSDNRLQKMSAYIQSSQQYIYFNKRLNKLVTEQKLNRVFQFHVSRLHFRVKRILLLTLKAETISE